MRNVHAWRPTFFFAAGLLLASCYQIAGFGEFEVEPGEAVGGAAASGAAGATATGGSAGFGGGAGLAGAGAGVGGSAGSGGFAGSGGSAGSGGAPSCGNSIEELTTTGISPRAIAVDDDNVYWATTNAIFSIPKTGGTVSELRTGLAEVTALAVSDGYVYWSEASGNEVGRIDTTGSNYQQLGTGSFIADLAVSSGYVFGSTSARRVAVTYIEVRRWKRCCVARSRWPSP